jgi:Zn-dependent oligopeptidases
VLPAGQTYADNRALREQLYRANAVRASEFGDAALDNSANIDRILALRAELAALLGFASYADYSVATKMADTPQQVLPSCVIWLRAQAACPA